jgi:hypothetical protein
VMKRMFLGVAISNSLRAIVQAGVTNIVAVEDDCHT